MRARLASTMVLAGLLLMAGAAVGETGASAPEDVADGADVPSGGEMEGAGAPTDARASVETAPADTGPPACVEPPDPCPGESCGGDCVTGCGADPAKPALSARDGARFVLLGLVAALFVALRGRRSGRRRTRISVGA